LFLIESDGTPERFVLRVLDNATWLAEEPDLAAHEAAALTEAQKTGVSAPRPVALAAGRDAGFGAPAVLMTFLDGAVTLLPPDFEAWLGALAGCLARIHAHQADDFPWQFESWVDRSVARTTPAWTGSPDVWDRAVARWHGPPPGFAPVFLHRDYHPVNVLWRDGAIRGVVDWINACRGPAGVDVGHCRRNLALMFGPPAAARFLELYQEASPGFVYDPYWDIETVFDACLPEPGYYAPWREFGLDPIDGATLRRRLDTYLTGVVSSFRSPLWPVP
jgi:aminoglycoside phosphotransferase (APT) family kinase protein